MFSYFVNTGATPEMIVFGCIGLVLSSVLFAKLFLNFMFD